MTNTKILFSKTLFSRSFNLLFTTCFISSRGTSFYSFIVRSEEGNAVHVYFDYKPCDAPNRVTVKYSHVTGLFTLSDEYKTDRNFIEVIFCGVWA